MIQLYTDIIYRPLLNLLVYFYNIVPGHDIGVVIILLTVVIRLLLWPLMHRTLQSQHKMTALQPKLNALRDEHKDNKEAQAKAMMELYKEHKINPLSSCLPLLLQLPLLFALYQVFDKALKGNLDGLYSFVVRPEFLSPLFLNLIDLSKPNIIFAILAGALQFWQSKMMLSKTPSNDPTAKALAVQTTYIFPLLSIFIAWRLPAGLPLYWIVTTIFAITQQYYIMRRQKEGVIIE
jgi:YidC/Oxa1 family membrane protein insertase